MIIRNGKHAGSGNHYQGQRYHAQQAAIALAIGRYIALACGHLTTKEVIAIYQVFGDVRTYCETCHTWQFQLSKSKTKEYPDEPMF